MERSMDERIELSPHRSLTERQGLLFFLGVCTGSFGFAGLLALKGFWPVLPFAGLEMGLLAFALKRSLDQRHRMQTILISEDEVRIQDRGRRGASPVVVFPRYWAQVRLRRAVAASHPSRLMIESRGRSCEVGQFLTEVERRGVAQRLERLIGRISEAPPLAGA
jgi:uncharacterized membrane protein